MNKTLYHLERLDGVDVALREWLTWWTLKGPFPATVVMGVRRGGPPSKDDLARLSLPLAQPNGLPWRDIQEALYCAGRTRAATLAETAHGRGGAVDVLPAKVVGGRVVGIYDYAHDGLAALDRYRQLGESAEHRGLVWGGRWTVAFPPSPDNPTGGDLGHFELAHWRTLPFPPVTGATTCPPLR